MAMEVLLNATKPPILQIVPSSANFTITGTLNVNVIQPPNNTIVNAFVLGLVSCILSSSSIILVYSFLVRWCILMYVCGSMSMVLTRSLVGTVHYSSILTCLNTCSIFYNIHRFDLNLLSSNVGTFPVKLIESSVNLLVQQSVIPLLNGECVILGVTL